MRKYSLALIALFLMVGIVFAAGPPGPSTPGLIASNHGGYASDPSKTFRLVRYVQILGPSTSENLTADALVIWHTASADDGVTITASYTESSSGIALLTPLTSDSRVAGIVVAAIQTQEDNNNTVAADVGKRNWGWLQTYGKATVNQGNTASSVGDAMGCNGQLGLAGTAASIVTTTTDAKSYGFAGFYMDDASAGDTSVDVFIKCE